MSDNHWNYRVIVSTDDDGSKSYAIHSVYYKNGQIEYWSAEPARPFGETDRELRDDFAMISEAFHSPYMQVSHDKEGLEYLEKIEDAA